MKSEERRALVLLGTAAIVAAILGAMLSAIWVHVAKSEDFYFNVPPVSSPIPHATFYWIGILEFMLAFWMVYAFFIFWYFSPDWISPRTRRACHFGATAFMGVYILYISAYIPLVYLDVVYVTDLSLQAFVYLVILWFILLLEWDFIKWAGGTGYSLILRIPRRVARRVRRQRPSKWGYEGESI